MLDAGYPFAHRHQRGVLVPGTGRIPCRPGPAGQVATSGKRLAGLSSRAVKYAMSSTTPSARVTACSAAATNDRPSGYRRNSDV